MSLEAEIKKLTEAVVALTEKMDGGDAAPTEKKTSGGSKASSGGKGKAKAVTVDAVAEKAGAFLAAGSAADKKEAMKNLKRMVEHFGVDRITNVDEEQYQEVLDMFSAFENGDDPLADAEEEGGALV